MKKIMILNLIILMISLTITFAEEQNVFSTDQLQTTITIDSKATLEIKGASGSISSFTVNLLFFPKNNEYTIIQNLETFPEASMTNEVIQFNWQNPPSTTLNYAYEADVISKIQRPKIYSRIKYPLEKHYSELDEYIQPTLTIDSGNAEIKRKAQDLSFGKDDLYEVVASLAIWVKENIKYDLSTLTQDVSQKASWVLTNKIGVCDELTGLFISMLRSLRIPARFISGMSYTNSQDFAQNWGPHGWAEVYFPGTGWVPYDPTFGEFGWVDAGHIKMMESLDPQDPSSKFEWRGKNAEVDVQDLNLKTKINNYGNRISDEIKLDLSVEKNRVGFGSYNLVIIKLENLQDYYLTKEISLARVKELENGKKESKIVILKPKEKKTLAIPIRINTALDDNLVYTIPLLVYTNMNESTKTTFTATKDDEIYSLQEFKTIIQKYDLQDEADLDISCTLTSENVEINEKVMMSCNIENQKDETYRGKYCFENCYPLVLQKGENKLFTKKYSFQEAGTKDLIFKIKKSGGEENEERKAIMILKVLDVPDIEITDFETTETNNFDEPFKIKFKINKKSYSTPKDLNIFVEIGTSEVSFDQKNLASAQDFSVSANTKHFKHQNQDIVITATYVDETGKKYKETKTFNVKIKEVSFWNKIKMLINRMIG